MLVWALLSEFAAVGVFGMRLGDVGAGDDAGGGEDAVDADDGIDVGVGAAVGVCCCWSFLTAVGRRRCWR